MNIKVRLSSVLLVVAVFVLVFVSFNNLASAQSGTAGVGDRQIQSNPDGTINYVVPGGPGYVSINGASFTPIDYTYLWSGWGGSLANPSPDWPGEYIASVSLPHGATVTKIVAYYCDEAAEKDLRVRLYRVTFGNSEMQLMGEVYSLGATGCAYWYDDFIENATIDNRSYSYIAYVDLPNVVENQLRFGGLRVDYTFPSYLPCISSQ